MVVAGIHNLTDSSIFALANTCHYLEEIYLNGCAQVSPTAVRYLVVSLYFHSNTCRYSMIFYTKILVNNAKSVDPDPKLHSVVSHFGLQWLCHYVTYKNMVAHIVMCRQNSQGRG